MWLIRYYVQGAHEQARSDDGEIDMTGDVKGEVRPPLSVLESVKSWWQNGNDDTKEEDDEEEEGGEEDEEGGDVEEDEDEDEEEEEERDAQGKLCNS